VKETSRHRQRLQSRITPANIELPTEKDEPHETLSEPATKKIGERLFDRKRA
jgi:hypothetical protein